MYKNNHGMKYKCLSNTNNFVLKGFLMWLFSIMLMSSIQAQCSHGSYLETQYVTGGGSAATLHGAPDGDGPEEWYGSVTYTAASFTTTFTQGAKVTITAKAVNSSADLDSYLVSFSIDGISFTTPVLMDNFYGSGNYSTFQEFTYTLSSSENDAYAYLKLKGADAAGVDSGVQSIIDAVSIGTPTCYNCEAGVNAPVLSSNVGSASAVTTFDLTTISSNAGPSGTSLSWHTALPVSQTNILGSSNAAPVGIYYAAFYHAVANCYSYDTSQFNVISDFDNDGISDVIDIDDDNDGIPDVVECPTIDLLTNGDFFYSDTEISTKAISEDGNSKYKSHLSSYSFNGTSPIGLYQGWDFTTGTPDWSEAQYLAGSSIGDPRTGGFYKINIIPSDSGGGFLIFSLADEAISNNISGLTIGSQYVLEFEMGTLPNYGYSGNEGYDYDIHHVRYGFVDQGSGTGVNVLYQTPLDETVYTNFSTDPSSTADFTQSPDVSTLYNPHWKKYRIVFEATSSSVKYEFYLEAPTVVLVDGFSLNEVDPTCTKSVDLDSDNDSCSDAEEAGTESSGPVGDNGLYDSLETFVDSGIVSVTIDTVKPYDNIPSCIPQIDAKDDDYSATPITGGESTIDITDNDTLDENPVVLGTNPGEVTLSGVTVPSGLTLNTDGTITVAEGTPSGTYEVEYKICENGASPENKIVIQLRQKL